MKTTLRFMGIGGLLCVLLFFPVYYGVPPLADTRRVLEREAKAGTIVDPTKQRLEEAISRDANWVKKSLRARDSSQMVLMGIVALGSVICLGLSMRKDHWTGLTEESGPNRVAGGN